MFIRTKQTPNSPKTAVQIVENYRYNGKVKQKVVRHIGYAINDQEIEALKNIAAVAKAKLEAEAQPSLFENDHLINRVIHPNDSADAPTPLMVDLKKLKEEIRLKIGIHQVYGRIFDEIGFNRVLANPARKKASVRLMRDIVMARIDLPQSKLASVATLGDQFGIEASATGVYRMMDFIDEKAIERIRTISFEHTLGLIGEKLHVIFYDCTTLYFESFTEDELKANGYSKDGKFNQSQVLLALMVTRQGLPVGYELFPGNRFEGHTLEDALNQLEKKYQIDQVVLVADAAMLNAKNIELLKARRQPFIVGARIKNLSKSITEKILDQSRYQTLAAESKEQEPIRYQELELKPSEGEEVLRLIVTHCPKRAAKDKHERDKAIDRLKQRLESNKQFKTLLNNYGFKKYIRIEGEAKISLNEEKIKTDEAWDGLHGIVTNMKDADVRGLLAQYHGLWQVEETFRVSKHDVRMRPIFHWTPSRIKAHVALCFMALVCMRSLEHKVRHQYRKMSPEAIRRCITSLEVSLLKDESTHKQYVLPSQVSQDAKKIYQILGLKWRESAYVAQESAE